MSDTISVAIAGTGNIAGPYAADLATYPEIRLLGVSDVDQTRADAFAAQHNTSAYPSLDALLADPAVDLVVNLTPPAAHKAVISAALEAGKHVYSEKPLATNYADAAALVQLAAEKGLRLACSPFTWLGEAQQTAIKQLRDGKLGTVRVAYAEVNHGRIESWHPDPEAFYRIGPLYDVGVYPLTILTAAFGPVTRVSAYGKVVYPDRTNLSGAAFPLVAPDFMVTMLEFGDGMVARLTTDFYVGSRSTRQTGLEFHGDLGSVYLDSWANFDAKVAYAPFDQPFEEVPLLREPHHGVPWGRGVWETVTAILADRPHRLTGAQAAHITEILDAAAASARSERPVPLQSSFTAPPMLDWAL